MRSIQSRLGLGLAVSLVAVFVLQWLVVSVSLQRLSEAGLAAHIEHDIDNLLAGLSFDGAGRLQLAPERVEQIYQLPYSGSYFRISSGAQVIRSRSLWDQDLPAASVTPGQSASRHLAGPQAQPLLVITRAFELRGRRLDISVARDLTPLANDIRRFRDRYALVSGAALVLLLALQVLLVRQGLRPLRRTRTELKQLERGEIGELSESVPDELRPLVHELNQLLATMKQRLTRSRQALGNLAHALKTPLTRIAQLASQPALQSAPEVQQPLRTQTEVIRRFIDRELGRARLAGGAQPGQRFDVTREVPALIETLAAIYRDKNLAMDIRLADDVHLIADREDMLELLGNLLDNACHWARHKVRLTVEAGDGMTIAVEDDGPGASPESLQRLAERGTRLDEAADSHGLGLAIARDIAASYGGTLTLERSPDLGGLQARVVLTAATNSLS
ncbi:MAG: sensor histidine kinase [Bacteroidota bacterium]